MINSLALAPSDMTARSQVREELANLNISDVARVRFLIHSLLVF